VVHNNVTTAERFVGKRPM